MPQAVNICGANDGADGGPKDGCYGSAGRLLRR
jgi:hypothetical protein